MTALDELFESARRSGQRFVLYAEPAETDVLDAFESTDVRVDREALPGGCPEPFVVIETDGEFVGALPAATLESLLAPPYYRPDAVHGVSDGYRILFENLDQTIFTGMTRRELLAVSREIEDRAFRHGTGTLRVGFQMLSRFESQTDVYRALGGQADLDVHVYGARDADPTETPGVTFHAYPDVALERYWLLAYDSGGEGAETCALLAREADDGYDSFWTTAPETTRAILDRLAATDVDRED